MTTNKAKFLEAKYLVPFILITFCFALWGLGEDAKFGAAGLIMAILGGSVMLPLQGAIIKQEIVLSMPAKNVSFILPFICFVVIIIYGYRTSNGVH